MAKNYSVGNYMLDDDQMQLLIHNTNSLVIAGAGSGKTLTIIGKVYYLIEKKFCLPKEILIISFTNATVQDLKSRIKYDTDIYTFHKLAMKTLELAHCNYSICETSLLSYIIKEYLHTCNTSHQKNILSFLNLKITYKKFLSSNFFYHFSNLIENFINTYKTNALSSIDILKINFTKKEKKIITIIFEIYKKYLEEKHSNFKFDFDDLIVSATSYTSYCNFKYKYIIIDEFQDTSLIRLNLIKAIYNKTNAKIIVVGDDWQSIYQFSGCDLNIFLNFPNIFDNVKQIKISNTYRNSTELIQIASKFIENNPKQIKKNLKSNKHNEKPLVFAPTKNKIAILKEILEYLTTITNDIMILSRNNKDIYEYLEETDKYEDNILYYNNLKIKYLTVHKSKGLEAEYVIILNCDDHVTGFPNKIENNTLLNKLHPNNEMKYAEERRLFYVGITRCKNSTILIYNVSSPSIFIKEIKRITKKVMKYVTYFNDLKSNKNSNN